METAVEVKKLMMVDDDIAAHTFHKMMMDEAGWLNKDIEVVECYSADEALDILDNCIHEKISPPQVILLDLNMPSKTGWDFLDAFSDIAFEDTPPVVYIITNSEDPRDKQRAYSMSSVRAMKLKFLREDFFKELLNGQLPV